ncbi:MAG TPA: alpha-N-acetylglucosaminidase [Dongiaceae bacterium]|nr:alpha-N-acetylglucosaminidase [Dongiaceae bacterium]
MKFRVLIVWGCLLLSGHGVGATGGPAPAANDLIQRLLPRQAKQFVVETIASDQGRDVFEIESGAGCIVLRGNNGVAIASALNRYLKDFCHADISWDCGDQLALPRVLPPVPARIRVVSPHRFRYAFNYCTHGYTMAWWDWPRWEHELDIMALNGVNLALITEGQEAVWINTFKTLGYSEAELRQWLVLPTHQPWMYMANMQNYGGPVSAALVAGRVQLAQKILQRMRELGMEPVLQGYYGIVPPGFAKDHPGAKLHPQGDWGKLKRPDLLDPTDPWFAPVAARFYEEQKRLFRTANFLAADPFHEGGSTAGMDLPACGRAIHQAMNGATWVLQSWQANPRQPMIDALDKNKLLILDLWCEAQENWRTRSNFNGTPWVLGTIHNFGGNTGMGGRLDWAGTAVAAALQDPARGRLSGFGALMEGSGTNPAFWERFFDNSWNAAAEPLTPWLQDYTVRRYGAAIPAAAQAWQILGDTIYNAPQSRRELPVNSVICARPALTPDLRARAFVTTQPYYDPTRLVAAWRLLLAAAPGARPSEGYRYDLADVGRQVLADLGTRYHQQIVAAYQARDVATLRNLSARMLQLIRDMDELVGTRREFLLGPWLKDARRWGTDRAESDRYERDARELITTWTDSDSIPDYANRQWNGLLGDFYYQRWKIWLDALDESLTQGVQVNEAATRETIRNWELEWTRKHNAYRSRPKGDVIRISKKLLERYAAEAAKE